MTQRELAKRAGIAFEHLNRIERGHVTPSVATAEKIERALRAASKRNGA
ncbi:MAG: helix-turn-helix transcriptional regulator [Phycisphaeraceae bacterium]|nr:helix-turn-helix transcriptional regulator [Phycisphaeraceae bacterium]